jgi:hypothetical protein
METMIILLTLIIAFDILALRRGCDSRDRIDSPEWEHLHEWRAFH